MLFDELGDGFGPVAAVNGDGANGHVDATGGFPGAAQVGVQVGVAVQDGGVQVDDGVVNDVAALAAAGGDEVDFSAVMGKVHACRKDEAAQGHQATIDARFGEGGHFVSGADVTFALEGQAQNQVGEARQFGGVAFGFGPFVCNLFPAQAQA